MVEAKDLMKKDIGVLGKGKSDPYAIVTVGAQQFKTQTIDNTINPKWDYWCEVNISWFYAHTFSSRSIVENSQTYVLNFLNHIFSMIMSSNSEIA